MHRSSFGSGTSFRRGLGVLAAGALLLASAPALSRPYHSFENGLRRSIAISGHEQARFSLSARMQHYRVPGVSVAVIEGCRIVDARGFGASAGGDPPVTARTLFQAGSISKTITAVAALRLVEQGTLQLDHDIRPLVPSWSAGAGPDVSAVTLRQLLGHTAGLNEVGGKGYARGTALPTLSQVLDGLPPANTPAIRIEAKPGTKWVYSSGGYYVAQAAMTSATGMSFASLAEMLVFQPSAMLDSSFDQPLDEGRATDAAKAAGPDGSPMPGGWRVNPELAAGGLWTTPSDLARFLIALAHDIRGETGRLLSGNGVRQMMTPGLNNWGLGVELGPTGGPRRIGHTGHNVGFVSEYVIYPDSCQGAVVMTNADQGGSLVTEILRAIGDAYKWPEPRSSTVQAAIPLTDAIARRFVGTYQLRDFPAEKFTISRKADGNLYWARQGHVGRDLLPEDEGSLFSPDSRMGLRASDGRADRALSLDLSFGGGSNIADRVE